MSEDAALRRTAFAVGTACSAASTDAEDVAEDALVTVHVARERGEVVRSAPPS